MGKAEKISVTMTPDMLRMVRDSVDAGEYASTSEVLRDALRLWQWQRLEDAERLEELRARVRQSIDVPAGLSREEVDTRLNALLDQRQEAFHREGLEAWARFQRDGLHLTAEEADEWLATLETGEAVEPPACHD